MRQKVVIALSIIFLLTFLIPSYALGQSSTPSATSNSSNSDLLNQKKSFLEQRQTTKDQMQSMRDTMKAQKEAYMQKREELKTKLQTIRDERKKATVERIDAKMKTVNTNRTSQMSEAITKMRSILAKIKEKGALAKTNGKDTTALDAAIASAEIALQTASDAVTAQAGKEYVATIESESTLRSTVGTTTKQLESDLKGTHKLVVDAKQAVMNARMELAKITGEKSKTGSPSGTTQQ